MQPWEHNRIWYGAPHGKIRVIGKIEALKNYINCDDHEREIETKKQIDQKNLASDQLMQQKSIRPHCSINQENFFLIIENNRTWKTN